MVNKVVVLLDFIDIIVVFAAILVVDAEHGTVKTNHNNRMGL